jgi:transcriptional regulator with XRE-family HTH domain
MARRGDILNEICSGPNKFGLVVAEELYVLGKTQQWLAEQCGVSKQYISQIIKGLRKPSPEVTEKIANIINVDVRELRRFVLQAS